jgi:zinc protease
MHKQYGLKKHTLANGLQVIIKEEHAAPKVSVQLWYNVGSKDEQSGEKGLAHLLEHMIFKGTQRMSESDINVLTQKLSGYTNAFTSYDYTGYIFDFPTIHWKAALDMLSDCMTGCTFKEDLLQSELKAVIQELKMYKDDYERSLIDQMTSCMFVDHPYHYPVIGYKHDLCAITQEGLIAFYKKHYVPNNATIVVVGDIHAETALAQIQKYFEHIPANYAYKRPEFYAQEDTIQTSVTLYRDIQRPILMYAWRIPGCREKKDIYVHVLAELMASRTSPLYRRLVDELQIATDVQSFIDDLFEHSILFLIIEPLSAHALEQIRTETEQYIEQLRQTVPSDNDIATAHAQLHMEQLLMVEKNQDHAYALGKYALATNEPEYLYAMMHVPLPEIKQGVAELLQRWIAPAALHEGRVLPLLPAQKQQWQSIQEEQDRTDALILGRKVRNSVVEPACYAFKVDKHEHDLFEAPHHRTVELENGMRVLIMPSTPSEKMEIVVHIDEIADAEPIALQGLAEFVFALMQEGTAQYSKDQFAAIIESHGMQLHVQCGLITLTCFKRDVKLALNLLYEMLVNATLHDSAIEKVRQQMLVALDDFWDTPLEFVGQLACEYVYQGHPWSMNRLGTKSSVLAITRDDLFTFYQQEIAPGRIRLAIVADIDADEIKRVTRDVFAAWQRPTPPAVVYPLLKSLPAKEIVYPINRDQIVLAFAGASITRQDPRYGALQLFDQILSGGVQLSMSSRLFGLREQTGLFYTIKGSMISGAGKQPGMRYIRTIVSGDRLAEAERAIMATVLQTIEHIEQDELVAAQDTMVHALIDQCGSQSARAHLALFMDMYQMPHNYIAERMQQLRALSIAEVCNAAAEVCSPATLSIIKAGRL